MEDLETPFDDHAFASSFEPPAERGAEQQTTEFRRQLLILREEADEKFQQDFILGLQKLEQEHEEMRSGRSNRSSGARPA
ncbi:hypothetical protein M3Y99_01595800 [Aphelenchoides fujianensis]|nr:hypothetical protein M3Y99_01595800 [Aphelenchoides fujianensis]